MIHKIAVLLSNYCVEHEWITGEDRIWCEYALETKCLTFLMFCLIAIYSMIFHQILESFVFSTVFYILRRRFGGWHAAYAWLCQIISMAILICTTMIIGPALLSIPYISMIILDIITLFTAIIKKPVYTAQTNFGPEIIAANDKKKNGVVLLICITQIISVRANQDILVYSFLGVLASLVSVYIEMAKQNYSKKGRTQS